MELPNSGENNKCGLKAIIDYYKIIYTKNTKQIMIDYLLYYQ